MASDVDDLLDPCPLCGANDPRHICGPLLKAAANPVSMTCDVDAGAVERHRTEIETSSDGMHATCSCGWKERARTMALAAQLIVKHAKEAAFVEKETP